MSSDSLTYIGRCACGAIRAAQVDNPEHLDDVGEMVAQMIRDGLAVDRVTSEAVRTGRWTCTCPPREPRRDTGLWRVRAVVEFVVHGDGDEEDMEDKVLWEFADIMRDGGVDDPRVTLTPVQGLSDLPGEWEADSLPYLGDGVRSVAQILAGPPAPRGTFGEDGGDSEPTEADLEAAGQARLF